MAVSPFKINWQTTSKKYQKCNNKVIVPADKTRNLYKVEKRDYK